MRNLVKICNLGFVNNLYNPFWTDEDGNGEWSNIKFFFDKIPVAFDKMTFYIKPDSQVQCVEISTCLG